MTRADVVAEALTWVGTPFKWQASLKGQGADCAGMIEGVLRNLGMPEAASQWFWIKDYGGKVPVETLKQAVAAIMRPAPILESGDVALLWFKGRPQHLGIFRATTSSTPASAASGLRCSPPARPPPSSSGPSTALGASPRWRTECL